MVDSSNKPAEVPEEVLDGIEFLLEFLSCDDAFQYSSAVDKRNVAAVGGWWLAEKKKQRESTQEDG